MPRKLNVTLVWKGVYNNPAGVPNNAGVYMVIAGSKASDGKWDTSSYKLLDIGQSGEAGPRLDTHNRKDCWINNKPPNKTIIYKFARMSSENFDETARRIVECCLRAHTRPPCGTECNEGYERDDVVTILNKGIQTPLEGKYVCGPKP